MSDREKLERVIAVLSGQLRANAQQRELTLAILEETEALLEVVSSEIPIQSPKRQRIEEGIVGLRALISQFRAKVQESRPDIPQGKT